ncbi:MAG: redoxin domain-containing protein [bacterium]|nr:MAG: redoxin domain-containing protein [bacterium]
MQAAQIRRIVLRSLTAVALMGLVTFSVSGAAAAFKNIKVGDQALPVELKDLEGQQHSLTRYKEAKAILLFFWATWSERSVKELEDLKKLEAAYADKGLQILAVNVENQTMGDEDLARVRALLQEKGIGYPVVVDEGLRTYSEWGVIATPTTALVDAGGTVSFDLSSYPTSGYLDLEEAVQKALGLYIEEEKVAAVPSYEPAREALLHFGLGKRHAQKGFMTKAMPEFEKAAVADSGWADPHIHMAFVHIREGEDEKARQALEKASSLDPGRSETLLLQAFLLLTEEKVDEAIALLQTEGPSGPEGAESAAEPPGPAVEGGQGPVDLAEVLALRDGGKTAEAARALEDLLSARLGEMDFAMKKASKPDAMEKMRLMMEKKKAGQ